MIQGFGMQAVNFTGNQSQVNSHNNQASLANSFDKILDSKSQNKEIYKEKPRDNKDFIKSQAASSRRPEIKKVETENSKEKNNKELDEKTPETEKTVEQLMESISDILAVLQNVVAINFEELEGVDLENINLEISLDELENLKLSLENLITTLDLGDQEQVLEEMISDISKVIEDVELKGQVEIPAQQLIAQLKQVVDLINNQSSQGLEGEVSQDMAKTSETLEGLINAIEDSEDSGNTKKSGKMKQDNSNKDIETLRENKTDIPQQAKDSQQETVSVVDLEDGEFKITIVSEKSEGINLFNLEDFRDIEEVSHNIEEIPLNILSNQGQDISPQDIGKVSHEASINPEQYMNIDKSDVLKQITSKIKADYQNQLDEIKIKLSPKHLGELTIKVSLERGILSARAMVENTNVKQMLETNIKDLKDSLKQQGMSFDSIDVSVGQDSDFEEQSPNFFMNNSKRLRGLNANTDNVENLSDMNYYEDLEQNSDSSQLGVGESSVDITV